MCDSFSASLCDDRDLFGDDISKIKTISFTVDGILTDVVFCDYSNKQFLVISQFQKIGTLILLTKGIRNSNELNDVYDIKTLSGLDSQEYHLAARYFAQQLNLVKPVLFSLCLKDYSLKILKGITKVLKDNYIY